MLTSCLMGVLRFSLVMSSSQPDGLVSQELITSVKKKGLGSRGILLQWSSEHPCPAGRRGSTATAAQNRQRSADTRGRDRSHLARGTSNGTVVRSKRCHGTTSGSSLPLCPGSSSRSTAPA